MRWLLAYCACYQAGISVVITLAAVYAQQVLGFKQADPGGAPLGPFAPATFALQADEQPDAESQQQPDHL